MTKAAGRYAANRRNAQKSTGPRSERGKAISRLNALTHGLNRPVVPDDVLRDMGDFINRAVVDLGLDAGAVLDLAAEVWLLDRVRRARHLALHRLEEVLLADSPAISDALSGFLRLDGYERKARSRVLRRLRELDLVPHPAPRLAKRTHCRRRSAESC